MLIINKDKFDPHNTKVLFDRESIDRQMDYYFNYRDIKTPIITVFKNTFGRQLKTWIGGSEDRRFYVWTFRINNSLIYALVHNVAGVIWEYPEKTKKKDLHLIHKEVYKTLCEIERKDIK